MNAPYHLRLDPAVAPILKHVSKSIRYQLFDALDALCWDPYPSDAVPLRDRAAGYWRIRVDNFRIIYPCLTDQQNHLRNSHRTPRHYLRWSRKTCRSELIAAIASELPECYTC